MDKLDDNAQADDENRAGAQHDVTAAADDTGTRLDKFLTRHLPDLTRSRLQAMIRAGLVRSGARTIVDPGERVKPATTYVVNVPPPEPALPQAQPIALAVVHEDEDLIVIDKPAGLVVHPAAGHADGTLVNGLIAHCGASLSGIGGVRRPGIVHRLDKDTSGLLVVAKNDMAHQGLSEQFAAHGADGRLQRAYRAMVWGRPDRRVARIQTAIGRSPTNRQKMAVVSELRGRHASTRFEVLESHDGPGGEPTSLVSEIRLELETGRTHQIRVHMAHIKHPILGDAVYGSGFKASRKHLSAAAEHALDALGRQALHAAELGFEHPRTREVLRFESPLPSDMAKLANALRSMSLSPSR